MTRVKRGTVTRRKHKKLMKLTKGYQGPKRVKTRREAFLKAGAHAYRGRKQKKRDIRALWITRIGAKCKELGISYSRFINGLKKTKIELDRKILAHLAIAEPRVFEEVVKKAQAGLGKAKS
ncbi:50S ribosomal protein L20 [Patescibacteria group bacterium]|nr:50S ribosomal protein L20 [Patescibacteria group bacterium]